MSQQSQHIRRTNQTLLWQSRLVLLLVVLPLGALVIFQSWMAAEAHSPVLYEALGISVLFVLLVWGVRAATGAAALTGGLLAAALYYETPDLRTALWPLGAMLVLALLATRAGRRRKVALGTAESLRGRAASQVAANVGVAALAGVPLALMPVDAPGRAMALMTLTAALAEATADTLASELGQVLGGQPRMLTTWKSVPAGTNGAITLTGTLAGCAGAAIVTAIACWVLGLHAAEAAIAFFAGIFGLFVDSLIGATLEDRGWLNNDAVNFLSTLAAAVAAYWMMM